MPATLGKAGERRAALDVVAEALDTVQRSGERFYAAELHRQKGELLLMTGHDLAGAARCFGTAAEIAMSESPLSASGTPEFKAVDTVL